MSELTKCAACRKEKPVREMKTCMHNQMHCYVCDSKCMDDFYNPPKKPPSEIDTLRTANQRLEGEVARLREALKDADDYLSNNRINEIGSGSILHRQMQAALHGTGDQP